MLEQAVAAAFPAERHGVRCLLPRILLQQNRVVEFADRTFRQYAILALRGHGRRRRVRRILPGEVLLGVQNLLRARRRPLENPGEGSLSVLFDDGVLK